eukprot:1506616-Pyramimonas_sp.AAC.2
MTVTRGRAANKTPTKRSKKAEDESADKKVKAPVVKADGPDHTFKTEAELLTSLEHSDDEVGLSPICSAAVFAVSHSALER